MNWKYLAVTSFIVNAALAAWLIQAKGRRPATATERTTLTGAASGAQPAPTRPVHPESPVPRIVARTNFHWSQVESSDYLAYIANLRRIGCPEPTIRDIIVADVNQLFAPRYAALGASAPELAWWGYFNKRKPVRAGLTAQLRQLDDEKRALLTRLLGPGAAVDLSLVDTTVGIVREQGALAFLPEAKQATVREMMARHRALWEWSASQWKGLPTDDRDAKEKALRDTQRKELAAILSPEELRELELRDSPQAELLREQYGRADLSETEYRKIFELRRDFEAQHPEARGEDWKKLEESYGATLGADRYADIQRQNDSMWRALQNTASAAGLSNDAMLQAFDVKREYTDKMAQAVGRMFADPAQNPQPLRDLAAEMDSRLAIILGPEAVKNLDRQGVLPRLVIQDDGQRKSYSLSRGGFEGN